MNLLEVKELSKTYGRGETAVHALKAASFSVPKGEFVAIVGAVSNINIYMSRRYLSAAKLLD